MAKLVIFFKMIRNPISICTVSLLEGEHTLNQIGLTFVSKICWDGDRETATDKKFKYNLQDKW